MTFKEEYEGRLGELPVADALAPRCGRGLAELAAPLVSERDSAPGGEDDTYVICASSGRRAIRKYSAISAPSTSGTTNERGRSERGRRATELSLNNRSTPDAHARILAGVRTKRTDCTFSAREFVAERATVLDLPDEERLDAQLLSREELAPPWFANPGCHVQAALSLDRAYASLVVSEGEGDSLLIDLRPNAHQEKVLRSGAPPPLPGGCGCSAASQDERRFITRTLHGPLLRGLTHGVEAFDRSLWLGCQVASAPMPFERAYGERPVGEDSRTIRAADSGDLRVAASEQARTLSAPG